MDLAYKLRVQERVRCLGLVLPRLHETQSSILTFQLLALILKLTVDLESVLELVLEQFELLLGQLIFFSQSFILSFAGLKLSHLTSQIVNFEGHFHLSLVLGGFRCGYGSELAQLALNYLVEFDLSPLIHLVNRGNLTLLRLLRQGYYLLLCLGFECLSRLFLGFCEGLNGFLASCFEFSIFDPGFFYLAL